MIIKSRLKLNQMTYFPNRESSLIMNQLPIKYDILSKNKLHKQNYKLIISSTNLKIIQDPSNESNDKRKVSEYTKLTKHVPD